MSICIDCKRDISHLPKQTRRCDECKCLHQSYKPREKVCKATICVGCGTVISYQTKKPKRCEECLKEYNREYHKQYYKPKERVCTDSSEQILLLSKLSGYCVDCGRDISNRSRSAKRCEECRKEYVREYDRKYHKSPAFQTLKHKVYQRTYQETYYEKKESEGSPKQQIGVKICKDCGKDISYRKGNLKRCEDCSEMHLKQQQKRIYNKTILMKVYPSSSAFKTSTRKYLDSPKGKAILVKWQNKYRGYGYTVLNEWFPGAVGHHINDTDVVFIPKKLHLACYSGPLGLLHRKKVLKHYKTLENMIAGIRESTSEDNLVEDEK